MHGLYGLPKLIFEETVTHNFNCNDSAHQINYEPIVIKVKIVIFY